MTIKIVVTGVGAAGVACSKILMSAGVRNLIGFDRSGAILLFPDDLFDLAQDAQAERKPSVDTGGGEDAD